MSLDLNQVKSLIILTESQPLPLLLDHIYFNKDELQQEKLLIEVVNTLLANNKTRPRGLELVRSLVQHCQSDILLENALRWASHCMVRHAGDPYQEAKLYTLSKILENTCGLEPVNKGFCTEYLSITVKACLVNCNDEGKVASLKCLSQCMKRFPVWFGSHKLKIEPFLLKCLEDSSENVTINAAVGFIYFLQAGSAGVNGVNYIHNFSYYFKKLCATVQMLYNNFFRDFGEVDNPVKIDEEVFEFNESINHSNKNFETTVATRIVSCLLFIKTMIKMPFCVEKRIFPEQLFDIVTRGLSVHSCSEISISSDSFHRRRLLNQIQSSLFQLLRMFMKGYQEELTPFAFIVKKILLNTWKKICSCRCFNIFFKAQAYKTLTTCLYIKMNMSNIQEVIIPILLTDIYPKRKTVSLNEKMNPADPRFKIKRNLDRNDRHLENSCLYALEALKYLLTSFSTSVQKQLQDLTSVLLNIIGELQINANVLPYNNILCQVKIYEILTYIFKIETTKTLPSIHVMTSVLYKGSKSQNWKISQVSSEGLDLLHKISHPVCTTFQIQDHSLKFQLGPGNFSNGNNYEIKNIHKSDDTLERRKEILIEENKLLGNNTYENANSTQNRDILVNSEEGAKKGIKILSDIVLISACSEELVQDNTKQDDRTKIITEITENEQEAMSGSPERGTETSDDISHNTNIPGPSNQDPTILETMFCAFHDIVQE